MPSRLARRLVPTVICLCASWAMVLAATLPSGFTEAVVANGLVSPTTMQFAPDGRLFVLEQVGRVRVVQNGVLQPTPFLTVPVDASGERGLLGIAFDPAFASNQYVYLYYTVPPPNAHNRVIRVTASGNVAVAGSAVTLLDLEPLGSSTYHNSGALTFGPDGKLYIAVGENFQSSLSQSITSRFGKILRINADGSIPQDNPATFPGIAGTTSGIYRAIWAVGLRNPINFTFNPTGAGPAILINDVGEQSWEEINPGLAGANYGWPTTEGDFNPVTYPSFTRPLYAYFHSHGCAVVGGAFYAPTTPTFPAPYQGAYFFADYCGVFTSPDVVNSWIAYINPAAPPPIAQNPAPAKFATAIAAPVDVRVGNDGALYYLDRGTNPSAGTGAVYRIQYGSTAPGITTHPVNQTVNPGQTATFSVVASGTGLSYQWQRNQVDIPGATSSTYAFTAQLPDNGAQFRVRVTNGSGNVISNQALLTVTTNQAPVATITQPAAGATYGGGQVITYAGTGTDAEDGALGAGAFTWQVDLHHDAHVHPFMPPASGATGGTFVIPASGHTETTVWYRIRLTVQDSGGRTHEVFRDIHPRVVQLTLQSNPPGQPLLLDSQPVTAPHTFPSVEGVLRTIEAQNHTIAGVTYTFAGWSDGGAPRHDIQTPTVPTTYTATFTTGSGVPSVPTGFALVANGATMSASWNKAAGATSYQLEIGSGPGQADLLNLNVGDIDHISDLVPIGTYYARVRAIHPAGASAPSTEASAQVTTTAACVAPPPAPTAFAAATGGLMADLSWRASPAASGYVLEVGSTPGASDLLRRTFGDVTRFVASAPAGLYYTRLRAANACGESVPTAETPIVLSCDGSPVVASGLTATSSGGVASFAWQAPVGALGYRVQVGSAPGLTNLADAAVGAVTSLSVPLAGVPGGTYYVRVLAVSACGPGVASNEVQVVVP